MAEENITKLDPTLLKIKDNADNQNASEELEARYAGLKSLTSELESQLEVIDDIQKSMGNQTEATNKYADQIKEITESLEETKKLKKEITKLQVAENKTAAETLEITTKALENTKIAAKLSKKEAKDKEKQIKKQTQEEAKSFKQIEQHTKKVTSSASGIQSVSGLIGAGGAVASSSLDFMSKHAQKYGAKQAAIAKKGGVGATRAKMKAVGAKMATAGLGMFSGLVGGLVKGLIFEFEMGVRSSILKNIVATSYGGNYKKATTNVLGSKYLSASETEGAINKYIPTGLKGLNKKTGATYGYGKMTGLERMSGDAASVQSLATTLSPLLKGDVLSVTTEIGSNFLVMEDAAAKTGISAQTMFKHFAQVAEVAAYMNIDLRLVSSFMKESALNADKLGRAGVNTNKNLGRMTSEIMNFGKADLGTVFGLFSLAGKGGDPFKLRSKLLYGEQTHEYYKDDRGRLQMKMNKPASKRGDNMAMYDIIDTIKAVAGKMVPNAGKDKYFDDFMVKKVADMSNGKFKFDTVKWALNFKGGPKDLTAKEIEKFKETLMTDEQRQTKSLNRISKVLTTGVTMDKKNQNIQQAMTDIMLGIFSTLFNIFKIISAGFKALWGNEADKKAFEKLAKQTMGRTKRGLTILGRYGETNIQSVINPGGKKETGPAKGTPGINKALSYFPRIDGKSKKHTGSKGQSITNADAMFGETFLPGSGGSKFSIASSRAFKVVSPSSSGGMSSGSSNQTMNFNFNIAGNILTEKELQNGVARSLETMIKERIV